MPTVDPFGWCHERQPCSGRVNSGLVLNDAAWRVQVARQSALVADVEADLRWIDDHFETAHLDANSRARADVARRMGVRRRDVAA